MSDEKNETSEVEETLGRIGDRFLGMFKKEGLSALRKVVRGAADIADEELKNLDEEKHEK